MTQAARSRTYTVDLPEESVGDRPRQAVVEELRLLWVASQVRERRISTGRGARMLGMPLARFLRELSAHGVAVLDAEPGELAAQVGARG